MSPRLIGREGTSHRSTGTSKLSCGPNMNLLTSRWSWTQMVFFIDPVGTLTAWTIKVIPKSAIIKVTTADSKYSRATLFLKAGLSLYSFSSAVFTSATAVSRLSNGLRDELRSGLRSSCSAGTSRSSLICTLTPGCNSYLKHLQQPCALRHPSQRRTSWHLHLHRPTTLRQLCLPKIARLILD